MFRPIYRCIAALTLTALVTVTVVAPEDSHASAPDRTAVTDMVATVGGHWCC